MTIQVTKTRLQVIHEAADKLRLVGTGQPLEDEYREKLDGNFDPLAQELLAREICHIADDQAIPSEWFDSLALLLANKCAHLGGQQFDPNIEAFAVMNLLRLTATSPTYEPQEGTYY